MLSLRRTFPLLLAAFLILNGCILERIFKVKNQLCDFDKNFQIEYAEGFRVILREPVMLKRVVSPMSPPQYPLQQAEKVVIREVKE